MVKSSTLTFTAKTRPVAPKYERVHFVAHCTFQFVDVAKLEEEFKAKIPEIEEEVGYKVYYRGVKVKGIEPLWLDVDFILDLPAESPIAIVTALFILGVLAGVLAILAIAYIWWTVYHVESEIFICDQDETTHKGRANYDAHLQAEHPEKWEYIKEQREDAYWWMKIIPIIEWIPTLIPLILLIALIGLIPKPERR